MMAADSQDVTEAPQRRNPGRIDHIMLAYKDRESQDKARAEFERLLGVDDFDDLGDIEPTGLRILISWSSGLELLSPSREGSAIDEQLATKGEGFFGLVFGVSDLDTAVERIEKAGSKAFRFPPPPDGVLDRFDVAREAGIGHVGSVQVLLGEFGPQL